MCQPGIVEVVNEWRKNIQFQWRSCILCGFSGVGPLGFCDRCYGELPFAGICCEQCGISLAVPGRCGGCQQSPPHFDQTRVVFEYRQPVTWLIQHLKFHQGLLEGRVLARLMREHLADPIEKPDLLLPVPLHAGRLRQRGFNQALELARPLARALRTPVGLTQARRRRATNEQTGLNAKERKQNLRNAFEVIEPGSLRNKYVVIVDDVMTTGSTVNELAKKLKQAGARRVDVWCCARAGDD